MAIASRGRMADEYKTGMDSEGSGHDIIAVLSGNLRGGTKGNRDKYQFSNNCFAAEILKEDIPNASLEYYQYANWFRCLTVEFMGHL
jgi:hypothetical protein